MADGAASRLFVYGTLMMPALLQAVCGRSFAPRPATLDAYARHRLHAQVYPAIVPNNGAAVTGLLCEGIDGPLWQRLDDWEGEFYTRRRVTVCDDTGALLDAQTYVLAGAYYHLLSSEAWSPKEFERLHLTRYLARWAS